MAVFRKYNFGRKVIDSSGVIILNSTGIRRYKFFRWFLPYLYGSDVEFIMKTKTSVKDKIPYEWIIYRWDGHAKYEVDKGSGIYDPLIKYEKIYVGYLSPSGHYILDLRCGNDIANNETYTLMVNFTLMDRDIFTVNWMHNLTSGIFGAVIGAIIAIFIVN